MSPDILTGAALFIFGFMLGMSVGFSYREKYDRRTPKD